MGMHLGLLQSRRQGKYTSIKPILASRKLGQKAQGQFNTTAGKMTDQTNIIGSSLSETVAAGCRRAAAFVFGCPRRR
jgi:hypothetical protein